MPFCENCGNKVSETAKFCSNCGEKVNHPSPDIKEPLSKEVGEEAQMKNVQLQEIFTSLIAHKRCKNPFPKLTDNPRYDFGSPIKPKDGAGIR